MRDHKECARQMRTNAVVINDIVQVSQELWEQIATIIENSVEVVRCKDCKWFYRDEEFNRAWCGYNKCGANEVAVNGYCYRGERREGE